MENQQVEKAFVSMNNILKEMAGSLSSELQETKNAEDYQKLMNVLEAQKIILKIENENIGFINRNKETNNETSIQTLIEQENKKSNVEDPKDVVNDEANKKTNNSTKKNNKAQNKNNSKNKNRNANKKSKYDDDKYLVDIRESHSLQEDFRYKRPHSFRFKRHYVKVSTWRELLIETCKYLYELNPEKFKSFAEDKSMQWGDTYNFSTDKTKIRGPFLIGDSGVYIETIKDSIAVRQMIVKMLNKYELKVENFKVYLKADYSK